MKTLGHRKHFEIWPAVKPSYWLDRILGRMAGRSVIEKVEDKAKTSGGFIQYTDSLDAKSEVTGGHPEDINGMPPDIRETLASEARNKDL